MEEPKETYKILLLGDVSVGKTSIYIRFSDNSFNQMSTIRVNYHMKDFIINNEAIRIVIWDTSGQEKFKCITKNYYKGAHGILLIYDVTDNRTLNNINEWVSSIREVSNKNIKLMLIANKVDSDMRAFRLKQGRR